MYFCPGAMPRAAPRAEGVDREVQGPVRHGLRGLPRARVRASEAARDLPGERRADPAQSVRGGEERRGQALAAARRRAAVGFAVGRREGAVLPHGRGVTRASSRTPTTRSGGCSTSSRRPGSSTTRSSCSSRTTARAARAVRTDRSTRTSSSTGSRTRSRRTSQYLDELGSTGDLQPLSGRLGVGLQHAVQDVEALQLRGRRRRPDGRLLAEGDRREGRAPAPVPARHRHRADDVRPRSASSCPRSSRATSRSRSRA